MALDLAILKRERAPQRRLATTCITASNALIPEVDRADYLTTLTGHLSILRNKLAVLEELDAKIISIVEDENLELETKEQNDYQMKIHMQIAAIEHALRGKNSADEIKSSNSSNSGNSRGNVKLPKVVIPPFTGELLEYPSFMDSFTRIVDQNDELSDVEKFYYLKGLLRGKAKATVEGLTLTDENYKEALDLLKLRFGDKKMLQANFVEMLLNLKFDKDANFVKALRKLYDDIEMCIRNLKTLGITSDAFGPIITPVILQKLPENLRVEISKKIEGENWDFDVVLKEFNAEVTAREKCSFMQSSSEKERKRSHRENPKSGSSLLTSETREYECVYCGEKHKSWECTTVVDVPARKKVLIDKRLCFNCLHPKHIAKVCVSKFSCFKCKLRHNTSICQKPTDEQSTVTVASCDEQSTVTVASSGDKETILLKTATVTVHSGNRKKKARILFDDASQRTYISKKLFNKLKLKPITNRKLMVNGTCAQSTLATCNVVQFFIRAIYPKINDIQVTCTVLDKICHPLPRQPVNLAKKKYSHLKGITLADHHDNDKPVTIDILMGGDYYYDFVTSETRRPHERGPIAIQTKVGWVIGGPLADNQDISLLSSDVRSSHTLFTEEETIEESIEKMWNFDVLGIKPDEEDTLYQKFVSQLKYNEEEKFYTTGLLWKPGHSPLSDNYSNSLRQLLSNLRSLKKNPKKLKDYQTIIDDQLKQGIIELCEDTNTGHYMPHHMVVSDSKRPRVVINGSSKEEKSMCSLNDCLFKGPSLNPLIFDLLLRFRLYDIGFVFDIKKAFLQIRVKEEDRDVLRILWVENPQVGDLKDLKVIALRFAVVLFGLNCSPFILNATLREHFSKHVDEHPNEVSAATRSIYVDDYVGGDNTRKEAYHKFQILAKILEEAGFKVHKFLSSDDVLTKEVETFLAADDTPLSSESYSTETLGPNTIFHKVLGIPWCHSTDILLIEFSKALSNVDESLTKRSMLSAITRLYDPVGYVSPVILYAKTLFQEACKRGLEWDELVPEPIKSSWITWKGDINDHKQFSIPRRYMTRKYDKLSLLGFCDASTKGYAAMIYLRNETESSEVHVSLIASKARVAPMRMKDEDENSIPRLELMGCLILCRLMVSVSNALSEEVTITKKQFWSDSTINLYRIKGLNNEYRQFVQNRLNEIRKNSDIEDWYYVPTEFNPCDIASRGCLLGELISNPMWLSGPDFIQQPEIPIFSYNNRLNQDCEMSSSLLAHESLSTRSPTSDNPVLKNLFELPNKNLSALINLTKFSCLKRLLRVTAYVFRFVYKIHNPNPIVEEEIPTVTTEEMDFSRQSWIIHIQQTYAKEQRDHFIKTSNNLRFFIDKVVRCRGRLANAPLPYDMKFPIFLPQKDHFTKLVVLEAHDNVYHQRTLATVTELRNTYWVPSDKRLVRKVINPCILCKFIDSKPFSLPPPPDLPDYRVELSPPFTNVGIDHVGPLYVKDIFKQDDMHKTFIMLTSCCSTRGVHLELQPKLDSPATIRAMKRTFSRVGKPKRVISDNHKTFRSKLVKEFATNVGLHWKFILERSPHWGGFYERMNSMIKNALRKTLRQSRLTYEELETIIIEIEAVINSRPLTYIYEDEVMQPLTPSHLMYGRRILDSNTSESQNVEVEFSEADTRNRFRYLKNLLCQFKRNFQQQYLTSLRERNRSQRGEQKVPDIQVGDVVLAYCKDSARNEWPIARVERIVRSTDNIARGAVLKTKSGMLNRPLNKLYPLEIATRDPVSIPPSEVKNGKPQVTSTCVPEVEESETTKTIRSHPTRTKSRRKAAMVGESKRRDLDLK